MARLTRAEKYKDAPILGYWSALGGIEVYDIELGLDTYLVCASNAWGGEKTFHRVRVCETIRGRQYVKLYGLRYYLDECLKA